MSRKTLCYSNLNSIFESELNLYLKYPVITATDSLARMINKASDSYIGINMGSLVKKAIPEWNESAWKFRCYLQMKRILREYPSKSEQNKRILSSFQRNMNDVLKAVLVLEEAEIYPDYLNEKLKEYKIFKDIWMEMEEKIPELASMNSAFQYQYTTKEAIMKLINDFLEKEEMVQRIEKLDKVVLLGFYYITPLQKRLLDGMEKAGIELLFLNNYNSKYPRLYDIWRKSYELAYNDNHWYRQKITDEMETEIGKVFSGEFLSNAFKNVEIIEYKNDLAFVNDITRILDEKRMIFTPNNGEVTNILKEFYPQMCKKKHILSYPIGQFIYYLHSMWDEEKQQVCLDMNALRHCFSSGWLAVDGICGQEYIGILDRLEIYFKNCYTANEWKTRLIHLRDVKNAIQIFEESPQGTSQEYSRWHQVVGNPFTKFSIFKEKYEEIEKVVKLVLHLIQIAETLFGSGEEINLYKHLTNIKNFLNEQGEEAAVYEEEKTIIQELLNRIEHSKNKEIDCFPGDLCDAIQILMGGKFEADDEEEELSHLRINAFMMIEAFTVDTQKKIHICMCDENNMPGKKGVYPWPISEHFLNELQIPKGANGNLLLKLYRFYIESKTLSNRYLFSEALKLEDVELSWISKKENLEVEKSIYLRLIDDFSNKKIRKTEYHQEDILAQIRSVKCEKIDSFKQEFELTHKIPMNKMPLKQQNERKNADKNQINIKGCSSIPEEVQMDYLLCPYRYYYGYVLETMPSYNSEFQYNFLLSSLIRTLAQATNMEKNEIQKQVFEMMPYLREIEKQQIMDYVSIKNEKEQMYTMDSVTYPGERLEIHFLNKQVKDAAWKRYQRYLDAVEKQKEIFLEVDYEKCMYCPHVNYCRTYSLMDKIEK